MASDLVYADGEARHDWYFSSIRGETECRRCGKARKLGQLFERCHGWPQASANGGPTVDTAFRIMSPIVHSAAQEIEQLQAELATLRTALAEQSRLNEGKEVEAYRRGVEHERARIMQRERRRVVTWLHERANGMNDPHAKAVLNSAAFDLGAENAAIRSLPADKEGA